MLVCPTCGAQASSWAARCPRCRGSLDGAVAIQDAPGAGPSWGRPGKRRGVIAAIAGGALLTLGAGFVVYNARTQPAHQPPARTATPSPGTATPSPSRNPSAQSFYTLIEGDAGGALTVAPPDGTSIPVSRQSQPGSRLVATGNFVAFAGAGTVHALARPFLGIPTALGPGDLVFPSATSGKVGVLQGGAAGPFSVRIVPMPGDAGALAGPFSLAGGYEPVAEVASGILVWQHPTGQLQLWRPAAKGFGNFAWTYGKASAVIGAGADSVAWLSLACDDHGECPMHLTSVSTGADQVVVPPAGHGGFLRGGAVGPDGSRVAGFVVSGANPASADLALVAVNFATTPPFSTGWKGTVVTGSAVPIEGPSAAAVWSPDSARVFFSGSSGFLHAYHPFDDTVETLDRPASLSFTVF